MSIKHELNKDQRKVGDMIIYDDIDEIIDFDVDSPSDEIDDTDDNIISVEMPDYSGDEDKEIVMITNI
ncbi:MAG: Pseudogene of conserved hypothetical protein [Methanobrevibacter sp. CfCl-M3]